MGDHVKYEIANHVNPEQFTTAISKNNEVRLAQQFIRFFIHLSKDATVPWSPTILMAICFSGNLTKLKSNLPPYDLAATDPLKALYLNL